MAGVLDLLADQMQADEERVRAEEAKREKDRDRKRRVRGNSVDIPRTETGISEAVSVDNAETVSLSPVPPSSPPYPPNNPLTPKPIQKNNSRGTRLPDDWQLTGPDLAYGLSKGLTEAETGALAERFKSWALSASGSNAVKRNWHQAFQGWVQRDGPKIIAARAGPRRGFAKPLTEFQRKQQETNDARRQMRESQSPFAIRSGGYSDGHLRDDHRQRSEDLLGGAGKPVIELSAAPVERSD
jgi:hypothetical protein